MRYFSYLLLATLMGIGIQLEAQTYYQADLSTAVHDAGGALNNVNYIVHYDSQQKDFLIANATNDPITEDGFLWIKVNVPARFTKQVYTSMEVCYDVFDYQANRLQSPPFNVPSTKAKGSLQKGIDSKIIQARLAKPLPKSLPGSGLYEVIDDMNPRNTVTEGYQCQKFDFPVPVTLPDGSQISTRIIIGPEEVFRVDRIRLYRN